MRKKVIISTLCVCLITLTAFIANAQERLSPLPYNAAVHARAQTHHKTMRTTALSLPFFDDFTGYDIFPDSNLWVQNTEVYVNNTMCVAPVSRGVVTFDALNQNGIPYDTLNNTDERYSDSLTSQPIDLSAHSAGDSLYLSFFVQPGGVGFYPYPTDSLMLYFQKSDGGWVKVWAVSDTLPNLPFMQAMVPVTDSAYFYSGFQFRFVNIAGFNYYNNAWNLDYVRFDAGRNINDTLVNDVAYSGNPTFLLNDYSYMPYWQFMANPSGELATSFTDSIHNNYTSPMSVNYGYEAYDVATGTVLSAPAITGSASIPSSSVQGLTYPAYTATVPISSMFDKVVFRNKFFINPIGGPDLIANDTIVQDQVFDNYLAYDDGSAEGVYNLFLSTTLPGYIEVEYHLNQPDTLQGLAIYFARQIPFPDFSTTFSMAIYSSLTGVEGGTSDNLLRQQDDCIPQYEDTINHYWIYKLDTPVVLPAGTFYAGTIQPAVGGYDTLNFGYDYNRLQGNHVYFNVVGEWDPSVFQGAIMIRPLLGKAVIPSNVIDVPQRKRWTVNPNPADKELHFTYNGNDNAIYIITDMQGKRVMGGNLNASRTVNVATLPPGMYFTNLIFDGVAGPPKKIIKQ